MVVALWSALQGVGRLPSRLPICLPIWPGLAVSRPRRGLLAWRCGGLVWLGRTRRIRCCLRCWRLVLRRMSWRRGRVLQCWLARGLPTPWGLYVASVRMWLRWGLVVACTLARCLGAVGVLGVVLVLVGVVLWRRVRR